MLIYKQQFLNIFINLKVYTCPWCAFALKPSPLSVCSPKSPHKASCVWTLDSCPSSGKVAGIPQDEHDLSVCPPACPSLLTAYCHYLVTTGCKRKHMNAWDDCYGKCYNYLDWHKMSSFELHVIINAYLSLSISLTFLFARHCLTIIKRVEALEEVRPAENRLARGRNRTRHKLSLGNCMGVWWWWGRYILKNDFYK